MSNARIIEIPATRQIRSGKNNTMRKMRVAAYCRVSTEEEEQQGSFETQKLYYTEKINSTSEWELAGIYADDGISGIHTKKRDGFNQMIQDCKKKKIDLILTKSISRFARNTLDSIQYVRMLKAIGIAVIFEKENINTSTMNSEMILTVLSAFAQAESESISQNVARGKRMGFRQGKFPFPYGQILGYRKGLDGKPEVIPEEAEVIRMIFNSYLQGASLLTIKKKLEAGGVLTARGNKKWSYDSEALPVVIDITHTAPTPKPDVPNTPNGDQIITDLGNAVKDAVKVECANETGAHPTRTYDLTAGDIGSITAPAKNSDGKYTVNVTIKADEYVKQYSTDTGVSHNLKTGAASSQTIALTYNAAGGKWKATGPAPYVTFKVEHEGIPAKPDVDTIYKDEYLDPDGNPYVGEGGSKEFAVILKCNKVTKHIYGFNSLGLVDGGYTLGDVVDNEDENTKTAYPYTCTMTVYYTKYMEQANKDIQEKHPADGEHEIVAGTEMTREIVWYYNHTSKWSVLAENDRAPIVIPVTCEKAPDAEMLETAVADPTLPSGDTVEVQSIAALDALIGRKTGIPEMVNGQWELQHRYVNFTRSGISISLMYVNTADAQQTIVGVINLISNPQYMMLSFEQSYEGTLQQFDGLNFYITENINKPVALWQGDDKLLLFSGRTSQDEVTSLLRTIIREMGE